MKYYKKDKDALICLLCNHYCCLRPNQTGLCGVNKNTGNKVECLVYGHLSALNIDPIEKKPLYHFLPQTKTLSLGTVGCNFKCSFCQNWGISQEKNIDTSNYMSAEQVVDLAIKHHCKSVAFTYNEPTIFYPFAKDVALIAKKHGLKSVYVSNGFESKEVLNDMPDVIDGINVDLKCFSDNYYKQLGGRLNEVCQNLKFLAKSSLWLEITTLIVPSKNDSKVELTVMASFIKEELGVNVPWHLSAFHPDFKEQTLPKTSFESLKMAYDIGKSMGLNYVYIGNVGFDNHTRCKKCNEVLIQRQYFNTLQNNLHSNHCFSCQEVLEGVFDA